MRWIAWALLLAAGIHSPDKREPSDGRVIEVSTAAELMDAFREPLENVTVRLAPGTYELTVGVGLSGRGVRLMGERADGVSIVIRGERGLYFQDCADCAIEAVTITDGDRDEQSISRDAAIYADNSSARIANCIIRDSWAEAISAGSQTLLTIEYCEIVRSALDGISLCDDAHAIIRNNFIEGSGLGRNAPIAAIVVACDAQAVIERNHLRESGVGIRVDDGANVEARINIAEQMSHAGIACIGNLPDVPRVVIEGNVMYECGAAGLVVSMDALATGVFYGRLTGNLIVGTGTRESSEGRGAIILDYVPDGYVIRNNTCYDNHARVDSLEHDVPREMFWRARRKWTQTYRNTAVGVDGRHKFHESAFLTRYGRWLD